MFTFPAFSNAHADNAPNSDATLHRGYGCGRNRPTASASFPLSMAAVGAQVRVMALRGGGGMDRRMTEMGLNVGADLRVVQQQGGGMVVQRGESRYALGAGMSHRVMVAPA